MRKGLGNQWYPLGHFQVPTAQSNLKITEVAKWTNCVSLEQWLANYGPWATSHLQPVLVQPMSKEWILQVFKGLFTKENYKAEYAPETR